ncbi:aspartate aminotransferase family protein [Metabacillus sediminilitoris]|uniref:Aspartate aminotransferase family protein n=1 Tax=Metabacillus sediminilitoris TaxID=2567941 RepID=A0A4S4BUQ7_9BACI|nr:aspartate aminotransferase family protein [Metabacillus sediminilitoris]QGQ44803.1 aminotransferase class III-fold pyridoxal phosphate-dependent enzyme [Metabacillus sediminilitoris]THF78849.1 aspartate aminotransferase family protein [Metabacillus sediminilitoris]
MQQTNRLGTLTREELAEIDIKHYLHPTTPPKAHYLSGPSTIFSEGKGIYLKDVEGQERIDGVSMLWNVNLGYGNEELAEAAKHQMVKLAYSSSFSGQSNEPAILLAQKVASLAPGDLNVCFFTSGGSESNDTAFKLARFYWKIKGKPERTKIISLEQSFHGVTVGATSATGIEGFQNFTTSNAPNFLKAIAHALNAERGDKSDPNYARSIRGVIEAEGADTIAAVIVEPIQGAGGVRFPPEGYLQAVRKLCDEHGILMIADEVICGFGRTGKMFGVDNWDVVPDLLCVAKGISSGYAHLGAVIMREHIREAFILSDEMMFHGFTYSGHPMACAVGLKTLEILERDNIVENSRLRGEELLKGLKYLESNHKHVTQVRGLGLLAGIELLKDPETGVPFDPSEHAAAKYTDLCMDLGLQLRYFDWKGTNTVALAPPLIITKTQVEDIINRMSDALKAFEKQI